MEHRPRHGASLDCDCPAVGLLAGFLLAPCAFELGGLVVAEFIASWLFGRVSLYAN